MSATRLLAAASLAALGMVSGAGQAALITNGFTYAVASGGGDQTFGTHFHSNTGGAFGNPAGKAEVGRFSSEEVRGLSEYDLTGLAAAASAFVSFDVFKEGGLFQGTNDTPFTGSIRIVAYAGNNLEDISDYQAASTGTVGTFNVDPALLDVGDIFSFDITTIFNAAITNGDTSLGIRLENVPLEPTSKAWTFDSFRLTSDDLCNVQGGCGGNNNVPEPGTLALLGLGLGMAGFMRRRSRK